jgi:hypothetical protein
MRVWLDARHVLFQELIPPGQSVTELESALEGVDAADMRLGQYKRLLRAMKES